ncbi:MAG: hypothetical protein ABFD66_08435 [Smithella sp.]
MIKCRFCFLALAVVFLLASLAQAQPGTPTTIQDKESTSKQLKNTPLKPVKSRPGTAMDIPNTSLGIMFTKLSVGPVDSNGHRYAQLTMHNTSTQPIAYGQYFLKYWWRAGSSDAWQYKHASSFQWSMSAHQSRTAKIPVGLLSGATEFRVTLHNNAQSPVICEISAPVM